MVNAGAIAAAGLVRGSGRRRPAGPAARRLRPVRRAPVAIDRRGVRLGARRPASATAPSPTCCGRPGRSTATRTRRSSATSPSAPSWSTTRRPGDDRRDPGQRRRQPRHRRAGAVVGAPRPSWRSWPPAACTTAPASGCTRSGCRPRAGSSGGLLVVVPGRLGIARLLATARCQRQQRPRRAGLPRPRRRPRPPSAPRGRPAAAAIRATYRAADIGSKRRRTPSASARPCTVARMRCLVIEVAGRRSRTSRRTSSRDAHRATAGAGSSRRSSTCAGSDGSNRRRSISSPDCSAGWRVDGLDVIVGRRLAPSWIRLVDCRRPTSSRPTTWTPHSRSPRSALLAGRGRARRRRRCPSATRAWSRGLTRTGWPPSRARVQRRTYAAGAMVVDPRRSVDRAVPHRVRPGERDDRPRSRRSTPAVDDGTRHGLRRGGAARRRVALGGRHRRHGPGLPGPPGREPSRSSWSSSPASRRRSCATCCGRSARPPVG